MCARARMCLRVCVRVSTCVCEEGVALEEEEAPNCTKKTTERQAITSLQREGGDQLVT